MTASTGYVAAGASTLLGLVSLPYGRYLYWRFWNRAWLVPAAILYLAVHALAGLVGVALASATDWEPTSNQAWNGILFGLAGAGLVRLRLEDFGFGDFQRGSNLLGQVLDRVTDWMDGLAQSRIEKYLDNVDDQKLARLITRLDHSYVRYNATPSEFTQFSQNVTGAINHLASADSAQRDLGRETLRGILLEWYTRENGTWRI
jgi:hypothetical protein